MVYLGKTVEREMYFGAKPEIFRFANEMRNNPTDAEKLLWKQIRTFRSEGFVFRRQHPIGIFIADFYCHKIKLVIEVDGEIHNSDEAMEHDDGRTGELERFGLKVLRFTNEQVINNQEYVLGQIKIFITEQSSPSLPGEGDKRGGGQNLHLQKYLLLVQYIKEYPCNCGNSCCINELCPRLRHNCC